MELAAAAVGQQKRVARVAAEVVTMVVVVVGTGEGTGVTVAEEAGNTWSAARAGTRAQATKRLQFSLPVVVMVAVGRRIERTETALVTTSTTTATNTMATTGI
jgi:hypothetical protein